MAKGNISRKMKKINGESLSGDGNLTLQKPWRKMYVKTIDAARHGVSFGRFYSDRITGDDTFNLSSARLIIECPPNADSTNTSAFLNLYSEDIVNVSDAYQNYGIENAISTTQTRFSQIEIVTDDDSPTYTITSTNGIGQLSFGQVRTNYGAVKITHKRLQSIDIFANGAANTFPAGTKFILWGVDK